MLTREEVIFESPPVKLPVGFSKNGVKLSNSGSMNKNVINHNNNNIVRVKEARTKNGACIKYVYSKVTLYYNSRIELKWRRALHHCQSCDFGVGKGDSIPCGAIHYGMCLPVIDKYSVPHRTWQSNKKPVTSPTGSGASPTGLVTPGIKTVSSQPVTSLYPQPTSPSHTSKIFIQVRKLFYMSLVIMSPLFWHTIDYIDRKVMFLLCIAL